MSCACLLFFLKSSLGPSGWPVVGVWQSTAAPQVSGQWNPSLSTVQTSGPPATPRPDCLDIPARAQHVVKYRKRKNASATGVPWDVCPRAEGTRQWDMSFLAAWYKHQPPTGYSSHSAGNGKGWAHLGLIRDPGKVKPSQGGRRGHGVDRHTGPATGLQTLAQNPQRQICRAAYVFFFPIKANDDFKSC